MMREVIQEHWKQGIDQTKLFAFKNLVRYFYDYIIEQPQSIFHVL